MEEQLKRIADALERLVELKEIEVAGLVEPEPSEETGDDLPQPLRFLNGETH